MSKNVVTSCGSSDKLPNSFKSIVNKTAYPIVQYPSLLLLTVQYPENELQRSNFPAFDCEEHFASISESSLEQRMETASDSLMHLSQPVIKSILYGENTQSNAASRPVPNVNPLLVLRNDSIHNQDTSLVSKGLYSHNGLSNIVVAPLPKSVVCTVMPKDIKEAPELEVIVPELEVSSVSNNRSNSSSEVILEDCDECSCGEEEAIQIISDKPITCRAVASLPAKFLYFGRRVAPSSEIDRGVFAKKEIPRRAQFGPMEGVFHNKSSLSNPNNKDYLDLSIENDGKYERLDVSDENSSNWMRYVRTAESASEQNLSLHQIGKKLYFLAMRKILPNEELKVWYSVTYAKNRNLPLLNNKGKDVKKGNKCNLHLGKENVSDAAKPANEGLVSKWKCTHCQKVFRSATPFNLHVLTHAADNLETKGKFNDKNNSSSSSSFMEPNTVCDKKENLFTCNKCKKSFLSNSALACHLKSHASVKNFDCPICKEIFSKILHLKQHIKSHSVGGNYICPYCSKKYQEYRHIRNHIRRFHCERNYGCLQCSKHFSTSDKLRLHMLSHSDHRQFSCATCGKQFKRKDKLSVHTRRIHLSPKLKPDNTESVANEKDSSQKEANEADYSEYIYKCHLCMLGFKRRGMLVNHLANRHPEVTPDSVPELNLPILKANRDYYCQYCEKIYKSSSKRKAHILKNHPGEKLPLNSRQIPKEGVENATYSQTVGNVTTYPQRCDWCHKQYASKAKLLQHQRKKHLNQLPKSLQRPKKTTTVNLDEDTDTIRDAIEKVIETDIFLPEALDISEYEASVGDSKFFSGGEFIIDASTLKRAIKGEVLSADCSPETLSELGQIIDARPDGYFKVYQSHSGITLAHPVEVWDPFQLCLSPTSETTAILSSSQ